MGGHELEREDRSALDWDLPTPLSQGQGLGEENRTCPFPQGPWEGARPGKGLSSVPPRDEAGTPRQAAPPPGAHFCSPARPGLCHQGILLGSSQRVPDTGRAPETPRVRLLTPRGTQAAGMRSVGMRTEQEVAGSGGDRAWPQGPREQGEVGPCASGPRRLISNRNHAPESHCIFRTIGS